MSSDALPSQIPLFPLAQVVLFPRIQVPLYIFEPRYRAMTRAALAGDRRIGMVMVRPEGVPSMEGDPPLFDVGCEGSIVASQPRPDGTYNLVLQGTQRFRIVRELPADETTGGDESRPYRVAEIERLEDPFRAQDLARVESLRAQVFGLLREIVEKKSDAAPSPDSDVLQQLDHSTVINALSQNLGLSPLEKQGLLETASIVERFARLDELLRFRLTELGLQLPVSDGIVH